MPCEIHLLKNLGCTSKFYPNLVVKCSTRQKNLETLINLKIFLEKPDSLLPILTTSVTIDTIVTRRVRKDDTILYKGNFYTVPSGYTSHKVKIKEREGVLLISDFTDHMLAQHPVSQILLNDVTKIADWQESILHLLHNTEDAKRFLALIRTKKSLFVREQFSLMERLATQYESSILVKAIRYCLENGLNSAVDCRNSVKDLSSRHQTASHTKISVNSSKVTPRNGSETFLQQQLF